MQQFNTTMATRSRPARETDSLLQKTRNSSFYISKSFLFNLLTKKCIAELLGTGLYVFIGAISISNFIGNSDPHLPTVALTFGFCYAGLSGAMVDISGGHFNPAVTLGVFVAGRLHWLAVLMYWIAQIIGAILGSLCVYVTDLGISFNDTTMISSNSSTSMLHYTTTQLMEGVNPAIGIMIEMILTMILVTVIINTSIELKTTSPALSGLTLAACILASYRLTGGSFNPARSFGPLIVCQCHDSKLWKAHYVYWIGPLLGGFLAGVIHRFLTSTKLSINCHYQSSNTTADINNNKSEAHTPKL